MKQKIYVWDPFVRLFHWGLVGSFIVAYLTGDEESLVHVYAGYTIFGLIAFRLIWGFIGPRYARFSDFLRSPREAVVYLKGLAFGGAREYLGHNPAGGWMVIVLLVSLVLTGLSGLKVYGLEGHGPLAGQAVAEVAYMKAGTPPATKESGKGKAAIAVGESDDEAGEEFWEEVHEVLANFTVFLVLLHIVGVALSSFRHRQNLAKSMITGYKVGKTGPE